MEAATLDVGTAAPEGSAEVAVFEAYLAYWEANIEATNRADPAYQPFLDLTTGEQRDRVVAILERMRDDGARTTGAMRIVPTVVAVSGPTATVQDCYDGRDTYDVDENGTEIPDTKGDLVPAVFTLIQSGSGWVVTDGQKASHSCS